MSATIMEWLRGKDVLVTGGTGFVGKCLIEKLLRITEVNRIYLIIRVKRKNNPQQRWQQLANDMVFDRLRSERPEALNKVVVIGADLAEKDLGMSMKDREELSNKIAIVFHAAACVRFDDQLSNAILVTVRGTKELLELAKTMKKLEAFQYVSTTFSNCNLPLNKIEEKVYRQDYDWRALIKMAEANSIMLNILQDKILGTHPNTYTMCKSLAEMVLEEIKGDLPVVILRPSVVVGSFIDPEPGWVDNFNGPVGVTTGVSAGVLRVFRGDPHSHLDYVTVDWVVNSMVVSAWLIAQQRPEEIAVYNCAYADRITCTFKEVVENGVTVNHKFPVDNNIWYPFLIIIKNTYIYHFLFYILQFLPGVIIDLLLIIARKPPILTKLNIKIYLACSALLFFASRTIKFDNTKHRTLFELEPKEDREIFPLDSDVILSTLDFMLLFQKGIKKFLLKEKESDLEKYRAKHWRLYYIDRATKVFLIGAVFWFCTQYILNLFAITL